MRKQKEKSQLSGYANAKRQMLFPQRVQDKIMTRLLLIPCLLKAPDPRQTLNLLRLLTSYKKSNQKRQNLRHQLIQVDTALK